MQAGKGMLSMLALSIAIVCGCGGGGSTSSGGGGTTNPPPAQTAAATPTFSTTVAQNNAQIVSMADATSGATIYYTLDGSAPTTSSMVYKAPVLVASSLTVKAIATASGFSNSAVGSKDFTTAIPSGTLVWSDEFNSASATPDSSTWAYDVGLNCCGNNEQETYCASGSTTAPCDAANPNAYVGSDGLLHIVARKIAGATPAYTSARMKMQNKVSFMYGRIEAKIKIPESQGM